MKKTAASTFILLVIVLGLARAQEVKERAIFRFVEGNDMFFLQLKGNRENLARLTDFINVHRERFVSNSAIIYVNGYCVEVGKITQRQQRVKTMSNRVKSELITRCGLTEGNFITLNTTTAYGEERNIVLVSIPIPSQKANQEIEKGEEMPREQAVKELQETPHHIAKEHESAIGLPPVFKTNTHAGFNFRTNLLYWAVATPNIGIEWRIVPSYGIKMDGGYSSWEYTGKDKIQKLWFINPEVRRYMLENKRFYIGLGATLGEYNLKLGSTGYQGNVYGCAVTTGYQLSMGKHFLWDFNIGLGVAHLTYDTFGVVDGVRILKAKNVNKTIFAPTQIGVSLIWHIGKTSLNKEVL